MEHDGREIDHLGLTPEDHEQLGAAVRRIGDEPVEIRPLELLGRYGLACEVTIRHPRTPRRRMTSLMLFHHSRARGWALALKLAPQQVGDLADAIETFLDRREARIAAAAARDLSRRAGAGDELAEDARDAAE